MNIRLPAPLRPTVGGATTVPVEARTLAELGAQIVARYPELAARVLHDGAFGPFVTVFVDGEDARFIAPDADISAAKTIEILPAMSGGATTAEPSQRPGPLGGSTLLDQVAKEIHGSFIDETIGIVARAHPDTVSFAVGSPAPEVLRMARAEELAADVLAHDGLAPLGYGITEGDGELREIVAANARARGLRASADDVSITVGAIQAIDITSRLFVRPGDLVVVESPGFANVLSGLRNHGARLLEVPVDERGIDVDEAARLLRERGERPRMFFIVPNFQNPSGATLSIERREQLVALAHSYGAVIIEDDPYRELRFRGEHLPAIASLTDDGVVSIGTFSKTFLPGVRIGWAISDPATVRRMASAKQTMDSCTSMLNQRIVVAFHRRGGVDEHLARLRALYAEKQARARAALARDFAGTGVRWTDPDGGFYLWVTLPHGMSSRRLLDVALEERVAFVPGDAFGVERDLSNAFRFSYSSPTPDRIDEGVTRLRRAFDRLA